MNEYKAVLFDLDGTLLNTVADVATASNKALAKNGLPRHDLNDYTRMVGHGLRNLVCQAVPAGSDDELINKIVKDLLAEYEHCYAVFTKPYPGITDMLRELRQRKIRLAVLSNKHDYFTKKIITEIFQDYEFEAIFGARENVPKKPDPAGALEILEIMKLRGEDFVYLGDSATDMKTALAVNMKPVGVSWGYRPAEEIQAAGAEIIIDHAMELLNLF